MGSASLILRDYIRDLELNMFGRTSTGGLACEPGVWGKDAGKHDQDWDWDPKAISDAVSYISDGYDDNSNQISEATQVSKADALPYKFIYRYNRSNMHYKGGRQNAIDLQKKN
jgi:hypothetical protein